jgi:hypothetical protein
MPEQEILPILPSNPDVSLKWQGLMFNGYDFWGLNRVGENRDQVFKISIVLVGILRKIPYNASFGA